MNTDSRPVLSRRLLSAHILALIVPLLSACSLIQVNGKPLGSRRSAASTSATSGASSSESQGERLLATYKSFDLATCPNHGSCASTFARAAGIESQSNNGGYVTLYNPRAELPNPAPTWLPGWDSLPQDDAYNESATVYAAMVQSIANHRWLEDCTAQYAERHAEHKSSDADFAAKIDSARALPALHARIQALLELRGSIDGASDFSNYVGPRYALEVALAEEFKEAELGLVYAKVAPGEKARARIRPRLGLDEETQIYCAAAARGEIPDTPRGQIEGDGVVRPVLTKSELEAVDARIAGERAAAAEQLRVPEDHEPLIKGLDIAVTAKDTEGRRALGGTPPVETVEWRGDTLLVTTSKEEDEQEIVGCKQTKDRVVFTQGGAQYDKSCKYRTRLTRTTITLRIPGMAKDVDIREGDSLWLLGRVEQVKDRTQAGQVKRRNIDATIDVDFVYTVGRSGSPRARINFLPTSG